MAFLRTPALLLARVALGFIFVMHGWQKFTTGHSALTADFRKLDVPAPAASAFFATWVELLGGIALILGVLLPLVGALLAINMIGALVTVHLKGGFWMPVRSSASRARSRRCAGGRVRQRRCVVG